MIELFKYIRGSQSYGLSTPESDIDTGMIYADDLTNILSDSIDEFHLIDKGDDTETELQKFIRLLIKSNPTALEALYSDTENIIFVHPAFRILLDNKDMFLSKDVFKAFGGYAISQIRKARGLNKKINKPMLTKPTMLDYMFVGYKQGSLPLKKYVQKIILKNDYASDAEVDNVINGIGITSIPNMQFIYGAYYDPNLYKGFITVEGHQLLFSSIPDPNAIPDFYIHYDKDKYSTACREYKEYNDWVKCRNEARYKSNLTKSYDSKNMMHCFRLVSMAIEIARDNKFILNRRNIDREFLMDVRNHKYEYDELMNILDKMVSDLDKYSESSTLPDHVDETKARDILLKIRKEIYNI